MSGGRLMAEAHDYVSTACHRGIHYRCRLTCKFCRVDCSCPCHQADDEGSDTPWSPD